MFEYLYSNKMQLFMVAFCLVLYFSKVLDFILLDFTIQHIKSSHIKLYVLLESIDLMLLKLIMQA